MTRRNLLKSVVGLPFLTIPIETKAIAPKTIPVKTLVYKNRERGTFIVFLAESVPTELIDSILGKKITIRKFYVSNDGTPCSVTHTGTTRVIEHNHIVDTVSIRFDHNEDYTVTRSYSRKHKVSNKTQIEIHPD